MVCVTFTGWTTNVKKVSLDLLLHRQGNLPLREARNRVEELLAGHSFCVSLATRDEAEKFAEEAQELGAICHVSAMTPALAV